MQLKTLALAPALAVVVGALETHGGYDFETRFSADATPETTDIKDAYESTAAEQAANRLREQIKATSVATGCLDGNTGNTPADLYALKNCIAADNEDNFFTLLADDIEESNSFWGKVLDESTTDRTKWVAARSVSRPLS